MNQGKVKFFNVSKGYGFITPDDGGKDVFVHATGLDDTIKDGDIVNYDLRPAKKGGEEACNVKIA